MSEVPITRPTLDTPAPLQTAAVMQPAPDDSAASIESDAETVIGRAKSE